MTSQLSHQPVIRDRHWVFDFALCTVVALVSIVFAYESSGLAAVLSFLLALPLMIRRQLPGIALATGIVAARAQLVLLATPTVSVVVVPILIYTMARWNAGVLGRAALLFGLAGSLLGPARWVLGYGFSSIVGLGGF